MKIALVIPNNLWVSPYVTIYAKLLEASKVDYTIISWDREGKVEEGIQYKKCGNSNSRLETLWSYICFARFVKQTIETNKFDKIIVFSAQMGIFLQPFL